MFNLKYYSTHNLNIILMTFHYRGNPSNSKRYKMLVGLSYGLPLIVSFLTVIVEFGAPQCASYRPRFGEETCFFSGNALKMYFYFN